MVRLGSVPGLPVVCGGRMLGRVEQSILTPSGKSLRGMVIRKGMGGAKWLENDQILVIGGVSVLARGPAGKLPKDADFSLTSVKDASGLRLGRVTDVFLNPETLIQIISSKKSSKKNLKKISTISFSRRALNTSTL